MRPEDDYTHPIGEEKNFNESMYFHFHSPTSGVSGFLRLANRPNEGKGERTVCLYLPDGRVGFGFERPDVGTNDQFSSAGLEFKIIEPFTEIGGSFRGRIKLLDDPAILTTPRRLADVDSVDCFVDLTFTRLSPPYEHTFDGEGESFAPNHYEQLMSATGTVGVDGQTYEIQGHGLRDHSWGPRSWQAPWFYRWLHGTCDGFGFMGAYFGSHDGKPLTGGFVWDGATLHRCDAVRIKTVRDGLDNPFRIEAELDSDGTTWRFTGEIASTVPLRHRKQDSTGAEQLTRIVEGRTTWSSGEYQMFGMCEYLDQIVNGAPVGLSV